MYSSALIELFHDSALPVDKEHTVDRNIAKQIVNENNLLLFLIFATLYIFIILLLI